MHPTDEFLRHAAECEQMAIAFKLRAEGACSLRLKTKRAPEGSHRSPGSLAPRAEGPND
jgi:hypothetical protein